MGERVSKDFTTADLALKNPDSETGKLVISNGGFAVCCLLEELINELRRVK